MGPDKYAGSLVTQKVADGDRRGKTQKPRRWKNRHRLELATANPRLFGQIVPARDDDLLANRGCFGLRQAQSADAPKSPNQSGWAETLNRPRRNAEVIDLRRGPRRGPPSHGTGMSSVVRSPNPTHVGGTRKCRPASPPGMRRMELQADQRMGVRYPCFEPEMSMGG